MRKIGDSVDHRLSNSRDSVDAVAVHPDGSQVVRLAARDRWFFARDTTVVAEK